MLSSARSCAPAGCPAVPRFFTIVDRPPGEFVGTLERRALLVLVGVVALQVRIAPRRARRRERPGGRRRLGRRRPRRRLREERRSHRRRRRRGRHTEAQQRFARSSGGSFLVNQLLLRPAERSVDGQRVAGDAVDVSSFRRPWCRSAPAWIAASSRPASRPPTPLSPSCPSRANRAPGSCCRRACRRTTASTGPSRYRPRR